MIRFMVGERYALAHVGAASVYLYSSIRPEYTHGARYRIFRFWCQTTKSVHYTRETHSAWIPASFRIFCHFMTSLARNLLNCSGVPPTTVNPCLASFSMTGGELKISLKASL